MDGKKLPGYKPAYKTTTYNNAKDASDCQILCQRLTLCNAFVYNKVKKTCNVKKSGPVLPDKLVEDQTKIFGPKYCPGM